MATIREKNLDDEAKKKLRKGDQKRKKKTIFEKLDDDAKQKPGIAAMKRMKKIRQKRKRKVETKLLMRLRTVL